MNQIYATTALIVLSMKPGIQDESVMNIGWIGRCSPWVGCEDYDVEYKPTSRRDRMTIRTKDPLQRPETGIDVDARRPKAVRGGQIVMM